MSGKNTLRADLILLLAAIFWGTTFIFQRQAMERMTPLAYTGIRFSLGALALLPLALPRALRLWRMSDEPGRLLAGWLKGCLLAGTFLFVGIAFQQYGLLWTTAGKAGFITSLYVVIVPLLLLVAGRGILFGELVGAALAVIGLYFLSFTDSFALSRGDFLVVIGAFVWAGHVLCIGWLSPRMDSLVLGAGQAAVCACLGLVAMALLGETPSFSALAGSWLDILWGGIFSVALGFTLQVMGQRDATPAAAAIILQMEAVVAAIAGWLVLGEDMTGRMMFGAAVMLAGFLLSQLWPILRPERNTAAPVGQAMPSNIHENS